VNKLTKRAKGVLQEVESATWELVAGLKSARQLIDKIGHNPISGLTDNKWHEVHDLTYGRIRESRTCARP